ncbi:thiol S-methyltransferase TMT1B-like [Amblyomma americanum]
MCEVPDGHFDAVLLTYVLCSATDGRKLLQECRRVLAKGGMLLFSEHVGHPGPGLERLLQDLATPLAKRITCGCHLNRDSGRLIRESGFARVDMSEACLDIPFLMNRHVYGFAVA